MSIKDLFDELARRLQLFGAVAVERRVDVLGASAREMWRRESPAGPARGANALLNVGKVEHERGHAHLGHVAHKRRDDGPRLEQVRMVAHFAQLHEHLSIRKAHD